MKPICTFLFALFFLVSFSPARKTEPAPNVLFILDASGSMWQKLNGEFKITVHVVGFGIEEKDQSPLECIAQAGGGQYLPANNAGELNDALIKTVKPPTTEGGYLSLKVIQEGKLLDASVKVFKKGDTKDIYAARTYTGERTNPRVMMLPAGDYVALITSVTMDGRPTQTVTDLRVIENDTLFKEVDFAQGIFEVRVTRNGELSDAGIGIFKKGDKQTTAQGRTYRSSSSNPAQYRVLPGLYDLEIKSIEIVGGPSVRIDDQALSRGGVISLVHNFESGELKIGAMQSGAFVDAAITISQNDKSVGGGRTYVSASPNPRSFTLEPGKYQVKVAPVKPKGLATKSLEMEIKAGETTFKALEW